MKVGKIHVILFVLTVITTFVTGYSFSGSVASAFAFSGALLFILGSHEMGHYFYGRKYGVDITPPYFIPAPPFISPIGTFGAFIKMKSPIVNRRILLDVGAAGPLAGLCATVPILLIGLSLSEIRHDAVEEGFSLGSSILFSILSWMVHGPLPDSANLILHPVAFSGWIGLLVTSLNLLPVGQLDGGHVAYAVIGPRQGNVAKAVLFILVILGAVGWSGWLVWAALMVIMGTRHPRVVYDWIPLDPKRKVVGWITILVFVITFTPIPF